MNLCPSRKSLKKHLTKVITLKLEQSKEIKQNCTGAESYDIQVFIILDGYCKSFVFGRGSGD